MLNYLNQSGVVSFSSPTDPLECVCILFHFIFSFGCHFDALLRFLSKYVTFSKSRLAPSGRFCRPLQCSQLRDTNPLLIKVKKFELPEFIMLTCGGWLILPRRSSIEHKRESWRCRLRPCESCPACKSHLGCIDRRERTACSCRCVGQGSRWEQA